MTVRWNVNQLEQLQANFPELTGAYDANALLVNAGRREVVLFVKNQLRMQAAAIVAETSIPDDILYAEGNPYDD